MQLNELKDNQGARHRKMRVGRGIGSGKGKTCGRGGKGQTSRTGVSINGFEGGQTPIHRRLPKRGFNNYTRHEYEVVNLGEIQKAVDSGRLDIKGAVNIDVLKDAGLVRRAATEVKLLAKGKISSKVTLNIDFSSVSAKEAIEKAGGKVILPVIEEKTA